MQEEQITEEQPNSKLVACYVFVHNIYKLQKKERKEAAQVIIYTLRATFMLGYALA